MRTALLPILLASCGWNHLPTQDTISLDAPLWDVYGAVPTDDGLYVPLPYARGLALVKPDGSSARVDLGEGRLDAISPAPDGRTVVAFVTREVCEGTDDEGCDETEQVTDVQVVSRGEVASTLDLDGVYNAITYSTDGRWGVAYLDLSKPIEIQGVTNLTSVVLLDLVSGDTVPVSVGFASEQVRFVEDANGASKLLTLSKNAVAIVDLLQDRPTVEATYPLTLDADARVVPVGVEVTPDGRYALLSTQSSPDLYVLDILNPSINIVELSGTPSDMAVSRDHDTTVLVYSSVAAVELVDHDLFDVDRTTLEEPMSSVDLSDDQAILWDHRGNKDVYRVDLSTGRLTEYRMENPPFDLEVAPGGEFAIALTRAEGGFGDDAEALYDRYPGMEIIDLRTDDSDPYLLEGAGVGVAFSKTDTRLDVLVLQEGIDYLHRLDLYTGDQQDIALSAPPAAIGTLPDGTFYITHRQAAGLVSFLDPRTGEVVEAAGFAHLGFLDDVEPIVLTEEEG